MSLNPEDSNFFFEMMAKELDDVEEELIDFSQNIAAKEKERNEERKEKIQKIRKVDWEEFQAREIKSSELRQQYLNRDSHRDKMERQDKVDKFKDLLYHKKTYDTSLTHNKMMLMDKYKNNQLQITDSETRKYKAQEESNRAALMAADARKGSNEVNRGKPSCMAEL